MSESTFFAVATILLLLFGFVLGVGLTNSVLTDFKSEAIQRGHADWVVTDRSDGTTEFKWKDSAPPSNPEHHQSNE